MSDFYILDGHAPVLVHDLLEWGAWMEKTERHVAQTTIDTAWISTVFLGLDHNHRMEGPPILFETMIFDPSGELDQEMARCATWAEAEAMHRDMCRPLWRRILPVMITNIAVPAAIMWLVYSVFTGLVQ